MKKSLSILVVLLLATGAAFAQSEEYRSFRVGLGLGYAMAGGEGAKGGVLWSIEPGYRITDQILANLRIEGAAIIRGATGSASSTDFDLDVAAIASYTVNGQYYLSDNNKFRPFVGLGLGIYGLAAVSASSSGGTGSADIAASASKFGAYPRIGFDAGHFTLNLDYNIIPPTKGNINGLEFKNSYLGIRIGGYFGGGKK